MKALPFTDVVACSKRRKSLLMSMTQVAAVLYQLQQLDLEHERATAEHQTVVNSLQGNPQLQKLRTEHAAAQQQLLSSLQAQKEAEWALEDVNRRLKTVEDRLYNGTVSNPKELASLQNCSVVQIVGVFSTTIARLAAPTSGHNEYSPDIAAACMRRAFTPPARRIHAAAMSSSVRKPSQLLTRKRGRYY